MLFLTEPPGVLSSPGYALISRKTRLGDGDGDEFSFH
jgi:hypothetical protein